MTIPPVLDSHKDERHPAIDPDKFTWCDREGRRLQEKLSLEIIAPTKGGLRNMKRAGFCVRSSSNLMLLKVRFPGPLKMRVKRALGKGGLYNEFIMLQEASKLGFAVPEPVAVVPPGWRNLFAQHALLLEWLPNHLRLRRWVVDAVRTYNPRQLETVEIAIANLFGRIRQADLVDPDFGAHNLMFPESTPVPDRFVWIDLECAFRAAARDPEATVVMANSVLSNWWVITGGLQDRVQSLLDAIQGTTPEPTGGWRAIADLLNSKVQQRVKTRVRKQHIGSLPQTLRLRR